MTGTPRWTRWQLLVAFALYCRLPFGRLHSGNPEIAKFAAVIERTPSALAMKLTNIASLDPTITESGRVGLRSASKTDKAMWEEMKESPDKFLSECQAAVMDAERLTAFESMPQEPGHFDRVVEDRVTQTTARRGQDFFRATVLSAYDDRCCITGLSVPRLLIASHIVPWRHDKRNRLNPRNGLALSALHDRAFDAGLITINEDLTIRISQNQETENDPFFAASIGRFAGQPIRHPRKFGVGEEFLAYHRENIFLK